MPADRHLAGARARPARQDHPQGGERDRAPAGRLPRLWRPASAAAQSQDHRRRHRDARVDGVAGDRQQIHGDQPRHLRNEVLLHRRRSPRPMAARRIRPKRCVTASSSSSTPRRPTTSCRTTPSSRSCAEAGIDIARRTVAKYREAMRIASSVQRRRDKSQMNGAERAWMPSVRNYLRTGRLGSGWLGDLGRSRVREAGRAPALSIAAGLRKRALRLAISPARGSEPSCHCSTVSGSLEASAAARGAMPQAMPLRSSRGRQFGRYRGMSRPPGGFCVGMGSEDILGRGKCRFRGPPRPSAVSPCSI